MSVMIRVKGAILGLAIPLAVMPAAAPAAPAGSAEILQARREKQLAIYMVRRHCKPEYILKSFKVAKAAPQWTWAVYPQSDGKYRVAVDDFTWDVDLTTKAVLAGPVVQTAVADNRLPEICLCVEGTKPPPPGWEPASGKGKPAPAATAGGAPAGQRAPATSTTRSGTGTKKTGKR